MRAQTRSPFEGMWSIAPATPEGDACRTACTDAGVARLNPDYFTANLGVSRGKSSRNINGKSTERPSTRSRCARVSGMRGRQRFRYRNNADFIELDARRSRI